MAKDDMTRTPLKRCSFCGKTERQVMRMVAGANNVCICNECIMLCQEIISDAMPMMHSGHPQQEQKFDHLPSPAEMKQVLDDYVIGQEHAKRALCVAVYNHYKRIGQRPGKDDVELQKSNILMVGPTGCGKTTLINLLMRFYEVDRGEIAVDGNSIAKLRRSALRGMYGMVLQETWLKCATVRENIAYGKPDATDEEIKAAAKAAYAHGFIKRLPQGYDTVIAPGGGNLSAGQKQLLCIARIMLCQPQMLILDEATSSIDTRTEMLVQQAFEKLMQGRTSFVVAHRLSTIQSADRILVMNAGHIIEQGTHAELLAKQGFYANLYNSQFAVE